MLAKGLSENVSVAPICTCFLEMPADLLEDKQLFLPRAGGVLSINRSLGIGNKLFLSDKHLLYREPHVHSYIQYITVKLLRLAQEVDRK